MVLSGGLGNQMFQYVAGRAIFGQSKIVLDYSLLNPVLLENGLPEIADLLLSENVIWDCPRRFILKRKLVELILKGSSIRSDSSIRRRTLIKIFPLYCFLVGIFFFNGSKVVSPRGMGDSEISTSQFKSNLLIGNFHSFTWFEKFPSQFREELSLKSGKEKLEPFKLASTLETPLVIQMRFGDFLDIAELNVVTAEYFETSLALSRARLSNPKIWIFSNDYKKVSEFLGNLYSEDFKVVNPQNFTSAQILELMKLGSNYIISNSTFGWWGAYLTQNPEASVCCPSRWYSTMITPQNLIPDCWERIPLSRSSKY